MDYEKLYKEALERARDYHEDTNCFEYLKGVLEHIFPELKELDDEKTRKTIIEHFQRIDNETPLGARHSINGVNISDIIAWLEKQGQNNSCKDRAEPKFKVGDWIVLSTSDGEKVVQIDSIEYFKSGQPRYITSEGRWFGNGTKAHLWSIQDAKDGDVLISQYNKPFIYNGNLDSSHIGSYCGISIEDRFNVAIEKCRWTVNSNIYPATKEQRDLLFQKMKDAGYEWDEDKKELSKIEKQGEKEEVDGFDAELNALLKKYEHLSKEELQEPLEFYLGVVRDDLDIVREEKPKWTDDDERIRKELHIYLDWLDGRKDYAPRGEYTIRDMIAWLKSIKQRMEE